MRDRGKVAGGRKAGRHRRKKAGSRTEKQIEKVGRTVDQKAGLKAETEEISYNEGNQ